MDDEARLVDPLRRAVDDPARQVDLHQVPRGDFVVPEAERVDEVGRFRARHPHGDVDAT
jgi:hypothetical protein